MTAATLTAILLPFAGATQDKALYKQTFEEDLGGWTAFGSSAKTAVYVDPSIGAPTSGCLRFTYETKAGDTNVLILPTSATLMTNAKSFKFWVRTDASTTVAVALSEEEGGRYIASVHTAKDKWQPVELSIYDFALATGKDDPKDPNGKLDLDRIAGVALVDLNQFFVQSAGNPLAGLAGVTTGKHTLYLDDFSIESTEIAPSTSSSGDDIRIDGFSHPQLEWITLGGIDITKSAGAPLTGSGMKADYERSGTLQLLLRNLNPWVLTNAKFLSLEAAATNATKLLVMVEETSGGKYNTIIEVPAESTAGTYKVAFSDFKPADDSHDDNAKLDPGQIKNIGIMDATALLGGASGANTLWIGSLMGLAK